MKIHKSSHSATDIDIAVERAKKAIITINGVEADAYGNVDIAEVGTLIVDTLPNVGETGIDYILRTSGGFVLYKWIERHRN